MRRLFRLLVPVCLALGLCVRGLRGGGARPAPVRLIVPRGGAVLAAGSTAELEWAPAEAFDRLSRVEEWEAFLSLDGGATYPVRITPHLDQDLRRIQFQVPPIPTTDARILLRFGDERRETAIELPERFAIADSPVLAFLDLRDAHRAATLGEPALPGRAGVVAWVEGSRRGGSLRQVVAAEVPRLQEGLQPNETHEEAAVLAPEPVPPPSPDALPESSQTVPITSPRAALSRAGTGPSLSLDILLRTQRQNE